LAVFQSVGHLFLEYYSEKTIMPAKIFKGKTIMGKTIKNANDE